MTDDTSASRVGLSASSASCLADVEWNHAPLCWTCWDAEKVSYTTLPAQEGQEAVWHGRLFAWMAPAIPCAEFPVPTGQGSATLGPWVAWGALSNALCREGIAVPCPSAGSSPAALGGEQRDIAPSSLLTELLCILLLLGQGSSPPYCCLCPESAAPACVGAPRVG